MTADYKKVPVQEQFQLHIHSAKTLYPLISPLKLTRRSATRSQPFLQVLPGTVLRAAVHLHVCLGIPTMYAIRLIHRYSWSLHGHITRSGLYV